MELNTTKEYRERAMELERQLNMSKAIWDGKITKPVEKQYKISLCTTCMGRAKDLVTTLPVNIELNKSYKNLEFLILDYNSQDGLGDWVKENMMEHIESGLVSYYRTEEPDHYSMTKSRNLAFKLANGDIVNNVDADNFLLKNREISKEICFAEMLNTLANQQPKKAIFAKGKRMLRGRLGFWKKEFTQILKGYNENINDYGHDDHDLMNRAWLAGFKLMWFGGNYYESNGSKKHQTENMKQPNWKFTEARNKVISLENLLKEKVSGNDGPWGKGILIKNFKEEITL